MQEKRPNPFWLVALVGFGMVGYGGYQWLQVDQLSPRELEASVAANYQIDLARMRAESKNPGLELTPEWEKKHRQAIKDELQRITQHQKDSARSWLIAGMGVLIFSLGRIFARRIGRARAGN